MIYAIPYDGADVELEFPSGADILEPKDISPIPDELIKAGIVSAFEKVRGLFVGKKVSIVVNDATRRLPTSKILKILSELIPPGKSEILIACGTHRAPTGSELDSILGDMRVAYEGRIFSHDCRDRSSLVDLGVTSRGTPVSVSQKLHEAECLICINSVEPHFFAGFTGGRKSFIPGLAAFETTIANHSLAKDENARSLCLDSNPLHADLEEAVTLLGNKNIFSIQLVTSRAGEVVDIFCGRLSDSFRAACEKAREIYTVPIEHKYDIVIAVGEKPLDINLYQLQKAQEHGAEAVKKGGILIVIGACREGAGSEYFIRLADDYPESQSALMDKAMNDNRFGIHKLVKTARRLMTIKIWYVTKMDDNTLRKVYYEPKSSPKAALDEALKLGGRSARTAILRDACFIVPVLRNLEGGK